MDENERNDERSYILTGFEEDFESAKKLDIETKQWVMVQKVLNERYKLAMEDATRGLEIEEKQAQIDLKSRELDLKELEIKNAELNRIQERRAQEDLKNRELDIREREGKWTG